jgi:hypothetical protein
MRLNFTIKKNKHKIHSTLKKITEENETRPEF